MRPDAIAAAVVIMAVAAAVPALAQTSEPPFGVWQGGIDDRKLAIDPDLIPEKPGLVVNGPIDVLLTRGDPWIGGFVSDRAVYMLGAWSVSASDPATGAFYEDYSGECEIGGDVVPVAYDHAANPVMEDVSVIGIGVIDEGTHEMSCEFRFVGDPYDRVYSTATSVVFDLGSSPTYDTVYRWPDNLTLRGPGPTVEYSPKKSDWYISGGEVVSTIMECWAGGSPDDPSSGVYGTVGDHVWRLSEGEHYVRCWVYADVRPMITTHHYITVVLDEPPADPPIVREGLTELVGELAQGEPDAPLRGGGATVIIPEGTGVPGCEETNECYLPHTLKVGPGTTVTWENIDAVAHTVTAGSVDTGSTGEFDSSLVLAGGTFEHTFEETGTYPYYSMVQPWMEGVVVVEEGSAPPAAPPADPASPPPSDATIVIPQGPGRACAGLNECYVPHRLTVVEGETVTWVNSDVIPHRVTGISGDGVVFGSDRIPPGSTFEHTFGIAGEYKIADRDYPWMSGMVIVEELQSLGHTRAEDEHDLCSPESFGASRYYDYQFYINELRKRAEVRAALCAHETNVDLCDKSSWPTLGQRTIGELLLEYYGDHCVPEHTTCDTRDEVTRFLTVCTTKVSIREGGNIMHRHITVPQGVHVSWANTRGDDVFVRVIPVGGGDVLFSSELSREADGLAGGTTDYTFSEPGNYAVVLDIKDRWGRVYEQVSGTVDVRAWGWYEGGHHYQSGISYGLSDETDN